MVKAMHAAGIEVILDVVYNHTAEGNHLGPTLSFRGIDNAAYYRLVEDDQRYYMDYTGTGNSLNVRHPHSLQLMMDSLRYWVTEMHVDGFRFDLASTLAREFYDVDRLSTFFELVQQDPVVSQVKLIAEPWDIGPGGYQVGGFPPQWTEWNGKYRDTVRDFWRGEPSLGEFASRIAGSSDLYEHSGRRPVASINFVTAHDGFTLRDLVSYDEKHNEANGEDNNDGESHNRSWNHGVEGPTDDPEILGRARPRAAQLPRHAAAQPGRADAAARRRARPHPARQQQHLRPGLRAVAGCTGTTPTSRWSSSPPRSPGCATTTRRSAASASSPAAPSACPTAATGTGCNDIVWLHLDGRPMEDDDWEGGVAGARHVPQRARHRRQGRARPADRRRPLPALLQRRRRGDGDAAARRVRRRLGRRHRHRRLGRRGPHVHRGADVHAAAPQPGRAARAPGAARSSRTCRWPRPSPARARGLCTAVRVPTSTYRLQISRRLRPVRGGAAGCPTCTTSASTGSTSRRCSRPSPAAGTGTTSSRTTASTRRAAAPRAWPRCPPRPGGSGWVCSSTSCPTTSASRRRPRTPGGGTCSGTVADRAHAAAFDVDWDAGDGRVLIPVVGDGDEGAIEVIGDELRYHEHRFPLAPGTVVPRRAALPAGVVARRRRQAQLPPLLRGQHARRRAGRGPGGVRGVARRDPPLVRRGPGRRATGRPPGRAARPEGLPRRPRRTHRRRLRARREDPRAGRGALVHLGHAGHHRATTPSRSSTGCSPTRPARRPSTPWRRGCAATRWTGRSWSTTPSAPSPTASSRPRCSGSLASWSRCEARQRRASRPPSRTPSPS